MTTRRKAPPRHRRAAAASVHRLSRKEIIKLDNELNPPSNTTLASNPNQSHAGVVPTTTTRKAKTRKIKVPGVTYSGVHETFVWVSAGPMLPNTWYYVPISEAGMYTSMGGVVAGRAPAHKSSSHTATSRGHKIPIANPGTSSHVSQHPAPPHLMIPAAVRSPHS